MNSRKIEAKRKEYWRLLPGDLLVLALVTVVGFASHGSLGSAGLRPLSTFIPLVVSWLLIGPHLGVFDETRIRDLRQIWRPFWAMVLAAPLAAFLRGVLLGLPIQAIFVVVIGGISALTLALWRLLFWFWRYRPLSAAGDLSDSAVL